MNTILQRFGRCARRAGLKVSAVKTALLVLRRFLNQMKVGTAMAILKSSKCMIEMPASCRVPGCVEMEVTSEDIRANKSKFQKILC